MAYDLKQFEEELEFLVNIDSGSRCIEGVNTVTEWFAGRFESLGWAIRYIEDKPGEYGRSVLATNRDAEHYDLLIISHTDTVFPDKTAVERPFSKEADRYYGPGVADMKAGCLTAWYALSKLHREGKLKGRVAILFNGEHELSCPTIRPHIEELSKRSAMVITTEPARANGTSVSQRKGVLRYTVQFHGKSAHSGVEPEKGHCAVTEMARFILEMKSHEDLERGIAVNPGIIRGGTSVNAIPDHAECRLDVRVIEPEDAERMNHLIRKRTEFPDDPAIRIEIQGGITRPPMKPNARSREVMERISEAAERLNMRFGWGFSGGGSDASFASAFGIPALCGLGPVGGGYHTDNEFLDTGDLLQRIQLFEEIALNLTNATW